MAGPYSLADAVAAYLNLLILQYKGKPKAVAVCTLLIQNALTNYLAAQMAQAFNLETAVGAQLDIIGQYVGAPRLFTSNVTGTYYGFENYANTGNPEGFRNYANTTNTGGAWLSYKDVGTQVNSLPDSVYAQVIQLKIILNSNDGTLASIMAYLNEFFPGQVSLIDTKQMELQYVVQPTCTLSPTVLQAYLPKPMGVGISIIFNASRITGTGDTRVTSGGDTRVVI